VVRVAVVQPGLERDAFVVRDVDAGDRIRVADFLVAVGRSVDQDHAPAARGLDNLRLLDAGIHPAITDDDLAGKDAAAPDARLAQCVAIVARIHDAGERQCRSHAAAVDIRQLRALVGRQVDDGIDKRTVVRGGRSRRQPRAAVRDRAGARPGVARRSRDERARDAQVEERQFIGRDPGALA